MATARYLPLRSGREASVPSRACNNAHPHDRHQTDFWLAKTFNLVTSFDEVFSPTRTPRFQQTTKLPCAQYIQGRPNPTKPKKRSEMGIATDRPSLYWQPGTRKKLPGAPYPIRELREFRQQGLCRAPVGYSLPSSVLPGPTGRGSSSRDTLRDPWGRISNNGYIYQSKTHFPRVKSEFELSINRSFATKSKSVP